jgi:hypothetical protein
MVNNCKIYVEILSTSQNFSYKWGGTLNAILFLVIAFIILVPILFFLPLGFHRRGQYLILFSSLIFALLGFVMMTVFPLWKAALLLVLLIFSSMYLVDRKLGYLIYKTEGDYVDKARFFSVENNDERNKENNILWASETETFLTEEEKTSKFDGETIKESDFISYIDEKSDNETIEPLSAVHIETENKNIEQTVKITESRASDDVEDDISFLERRIQLLDSGETLSEYEEKTYALSNDEIDIEQIDVSHFAKEDEEHWLNINDDFIEEIHLSPLDETDEKKEEELPSLFDDVIPELQFDNIESQK